MVLAVLGVARLAIARGSMTSPGATGKLVSGGACVLGAAVLSGQGTWGSPLALALAIGGFAVCRALGPRDPLA